MSWKLSAVVALGCVMVCQGPAWADGEAEAPPSPGQARRPPSAAEIPDRLDEKPRSVPAKLPSQARTASPSKVGSDAVKPMLPADYRPHGDAGVAKEAPVAPTGKVAPPPATAATPRKGIPLAPSAAQLRREIALRDGGPPAPPVDDKSTAERMSDKATSTPNQRRNWPTTVTNTAGPTSPAGPGSAQDRKGTVIEATGPQQGVIRNRW